MIILSKIINNNQKNTIFVSGIKVFNNIINIATNNFNFLRYKTLPILIILSIVSNNAFSQNNNISQDGSKNKPISQKLWQGLSQQDVDLLKKIINSINSKKYQEALELTKKHEINIKKQNNNSNKSQSDLIKSPPHLVSAINDIALWYQFSDKNTISNANFTDISSFTENGQFYPNIEDLQRNVEKVALINDIPYNKAEKYFKSNPANTKESKLYLLQSEINFFNNFKGSPKEKAKLYQQIRELIGEVWIKENFDKDDEKTFIDKFKQHITVKDCINRINRLLWDNRFEDAKRIIHLVGDDYRSLFEAIIKINEIPRNIDEILSQVPRSLRNSEILIHRKILWHKSRDQIEELLDLMIDLPENSDFAQKWWNLRKLYGREMLKKRRYKIAYLLFSKHNLPINSPDFWEAEWSSGWIALRFLKNPNQSYRHFEKLYKNVNQPVTLSRASYWLGMASQEKGDKKLAIDWYKNAAKYPIFFYGQLAIHKHRSLDPVGAKNDIILPKDPEIYLKDVKAISESRAVQIAYLLSLMGEKNSATKIFEWVINNSKSDGEIAIIMKIINEIGDATMDAKITRVAAKRNVFFVKEKFKIVNSVINDPQSPLIHAIIKQESAFLPSAVSQVGAIGYMQLMPDTARLVAKEIGVNYDRKKLASDINYNIRLGSHYIKKLLNKFDGSEIMAIASYNAGPNATQRWANEFYDPRNVDDIDKVVDWIELITYSETRNYVQRVMENLIVYKYLMAHREYDDIK